MSETAQSIPICTAARAVIRDKAKAAVDQAWFFQDADEWRGFDRNMALVGSCSMEDAKARLKAFDDAWRGYVDAS